MPAGRGERGQEGRPGKMGRGGGKRIRDMQLISAAENEALMTGAWRSSRERPVAQHTTR